MPKRRYMQLSAEEQRDIASEYADGDGGSSMQAIADAHRLAKGTVQHVIERAREHDDPVQPRGHKKRNARSQAGAQIATNTRP